MCVTSILLFTLLPGRNQKKPDPPCHDTSHLGRLKLVGQLSVFWQRKTQQISCYEYPFTLRHYYIIYQPKQGTIEGKSLQTLIHLHCLIPPKKKGIFNDPFSLKKNRDNSSFVPFSPSKKKPATFPDLLPSRFSLPQKKRNRAPRRPRHWQRHWHSPGASTPWRTGRKFHLLMLQKSGDITS